VRRIELQLDVAPSHYEPGQTPASEGRDDSTAAQGSSRADPAQEREAVRL